MNSETMKFASILSPPISFSTDTNPDELSPSYITDISEKIKVMRRQEDTAYFCTDYLKERTPNMIDEICRSKMLNWYFQTADCGVCERDTVVVAMSYLDRFLSSDTARAVDVIESRDKYQLASITTLYMAIKLMEQFKIKTTDLEELCKNAFAAEDFAQMEYDILSALNWRVHGPTVLSFLEYFFALIPTATSMQNKVTWQILKQKSKQYIEFILGDFYFVTRRPSTVAIAIIVNSLKHVSYELLNEADRLNFFFQIMSVSEIDLGWQEITSATKRVASFLIKSLA